MTTVVWKLLLIFAIYMLHVGNGSPLPDEKIPSMARKAGGGWRRKVIQESTQAPILTAELEDPSANNVEIGVVDSDEPDSNYDGEETDCRPSEFWHIRGKACVPLKCRAGRNPETRECLQIYGSFGSSYFSGRYGRNMYGFSSKGGTPWHRRIRYRNGRVVG
ncbi:uncharacterized protein LOC110849603 isoform X2 [Folsomia candida]|nr:uncharacterized protein LOC110849603 isoform X2 [Folsomia candida]